MDHYKRIYTCDRCNKVFMTWAENVRELKLDSYYIECNIRNDNVSKEDKENEWPDDIFNVCEQCFNEFKLFMTGIEVKKKECFDVDMKTIWKEVDTKLDKAIKELKLKGEYEKD